MAPPSPAWGLSPATPMRGRRKPAARMVRSASSMACTTPSTVSRSATSRSGTCDVTRAFHMPSTTLNSLARPSWASRALAHCRLVLGVQAGLVHGLLVERHEADSVHPAGGREVERLTEPLQHRGPGRNRDPAARRLGGVHGGHVEKVRNSVGVVRVLHGGNLANRCLDPGDLPAGPEHPRVRDDEDVGPVPHILEVEQPAHQLRSDARRVALHQRYRRLHGSPAIRPSAGRASCRSMESHLSVPWS